MFSKNVTIQQGMENDINAVRRASHVVLVLILLFFLPYFPGTSFRIDQFVGIAYIVLVMFAMLGRGLSFNERVEERLTLIAFSALIYVFLRMIPDLYFPLKLLNYQLYFAASMSIWYVHRRALVLGSNQFIVTLLALSIPISIFSVFQYYFKDSSFVGFMLNWYGGKGNDEYDLAEIGIYGNSNTMAGIQVLSGTAMTSIFSGKHSLAMFCLFIIAMGIGVLRDSELKQKFKRLAIVAVILAIIAGLLSTSKLFVMGVLVFLTTLLLFSPVLASPGFVMLGVVVFSLVVVAAVYLGSQLRVLGDLVDLLLSGEIWRIFDSRYGEYGYLTQSNEIISRPMTWIAGVGAHAGEWKISDSQYRSTFLIGGVPYFLLYFSFVAYLLVLNWRYRRHSPYSLPFFALGIALILGGFGINVYWQARVTVLWVIANMLLVVPRYKT